jgi:hypothetical protein
MIKKFFRITEPYKFEWNDLRCAGMVINVILIMCFGLSISWLGLGIAVVGIIRDLTTDRRVSGLVMHISSAVLNIYFLSLLYNGGI